MTIILATVPRSGTWRHKYFWFYYAQLLEVGKVEKSISPPFKQPIDENKEIFVCHVWNPQGKTTEHKDKMVGYNWAGQHKEVKVGNPQFVYLYRNPLDQAVSYYQHSQHHANVGVRKMWEQWRNNKEDYLFNYAIPAFINQYMSHQTGGSHMVRYEDMMSDPLNHFHDLIQHLGITMNREYIIEAVRRTEYNEMKALESGMKRGLAGDQIDGTHLNDPNPGKWYKFFDNPDQVAKKAQAILEKHGITEFGYGGAIKGKFSTDTRPSSGGGVRKQIKAKVKVEAPKPAPTPKPKAKPKAKAKPKKATKKGAKAKK